MIVQDTYTINARDVMLYITTRIVIFWKSKGSQNRRKNFPCVAVYYNFYLLSYLRTFVVLTFLQRRGQKMLFYVFIYPGKKLASLANRKLFLISIRYEEDTGVVSNIWPVDFYDKIRF